MVCEAGWKPDDANEDGNGVNRPAAGWANYPPADGPKKDARHWAGRGPYRYPDCRDLASCYHYRDYPGGFPAYYRASHPAQTANAAFVSLWLEVLCRDEALPRREGVNRDCQNHRRGGSRPGFQLPPAACFLRFSREAAFAAANWHHDFARGYPRPDGFPWQVALSAGPGRVFAALANGAGSGCGYPLKELL